MNQASGSANIVNGANIANGADTTKGGDSALTDRQGTAPVCIVGAGPIGIELAVALKQSGIEFVMIEAGPIGQTMSWWAPQTRWFSSNERIAIAGVPLVTEDQQKATREQYLTYLRAVVHQFDLDVRTFEKVIAVKPARSGGFHVFTETVADADNRKTEASQRVVTCRAVVLAIGGTDFPKQLQIPGEEMPHVDGYLREPHRYCGRRVMIIGGRNGAVEAAIRLHHAGAKVAISYRGSQLPTDSIKYWLSPEINGLISAGRIEAHFGTIPVSIQSDSITLESVEGGAKHEIPVDDVLKMVGYEQDKSLLTQCGVELQDDCWRPVFHPQTMETNVAGIYVAGTAVAGTQNSKYKTFLENCHDHVDKIVAHLGGVDSIDATRDYAKQASVMPES